MDEERERGRINGWATSRKKSAEHALKLIPALEQAKEELKKPTQSLTSRAVADWLNAHDYKTIRGKVFRQMTVDRLLYETGSKMRGYAERERAINRAMIDFKKLPDRAVRLAAVENEYVAAIKASEEIDRKLAAVLKFD